MSLDLNLNSKLNHSINVETTQEVIKINFPALIGVGRRQQTLRDDEVGILFREPFLTSGYRISYQSWSYYLISLFHLHNESFNIWSHLTAVVIFTYKLYYCSQQIDLLGNPLGNALLGFTFGILSYSGLSALAHLFHSKSELIHLLFFQLDYIGIGLNSTGTCLALYCFTGTSRFYDVTQTFFLPLNFFLGFIVCVTFGLTKLLYRRPYPAVQKVLKLGSAVVHLLLGSVPLLFRAYECTRGNDEECFEGCLSRHLIYTLSFTVAGFFYATSLPERLSPGTFDNFCHGHMLFHVLATLTSLLQYEAALYEIKCKPRDLVDRMTNGQSIGGLIFAGMTAVILADVLFIVMTRDLRRKCVQETRLNHVTYVELDKQNYVTDEELKTSIKGEKKKKTK